MFKHLTIVSLFTASTAMTSAEQLTLYTEVFPPYNFVQHNQLTGINTKIMESLCERAKLSCTFSVLPWKRAMSLTLAQPNAGIYSTSRTAKRETQFYWVGPLVSGHSCLYRLNARNDIKVTSTQSLQNYTIGVSRGDVYQTVLADFNLTEGQQFLTYSKKFEELKMFKQGKHDLLIGSSLTLSSQLMNVGMSPDQVTPVFELDKQNYQYAYITGYNKEYLWFLSRTPTVTEQQMQDFINTAKEYGFKTDELIYVDHNSL